MITKIIFVKNTGLFAPRHACPDLPFLHGDPNPRPFRGRRAQVPPGRKLPLLPRRAGGAAWGQRACSAAPALRSGGGSGWEKLRRVPAVSPPAPAPAPAGLSVTASGARRCHLPRAWERERPAVHSPARRLSESIRQDRHSAPPPPPLPPPPFLPTPCFCQVYIRPNYFGMGCQSCFQDRPDHP